MADSKPISHIKVKHPGAFRAWAQRHHVLQNGKVGPKAIAAGKKAGGHVARMANLAATYAKYRPK